jgi:hypothetical protein
MKKTFFTKPQLILACDKVIFTTVQNWDQDHYFRDNVINAKIKTSNLQIQYIM